MLSILAAKLDLILANVGGTPTIARGEATSIIYVTFSKDVEINGWTVLDDSEGP